MTVFIMRCVGQGRWLQWGVEGDVIYSKECIESNDMASWNFREANLILS